MAPSTVNIRDTDGCSPMVAVLCHRRFWMAAVDDRLGLADVVVLDLSGYTDAHAGTHHELQRIIDRFPIERVVLLADLVSNTEFLVAPVHEIWATIAPSTEANTSTSTQVRLVADRTRARQLATMALARVPG